MPDQHPAKGTHSAARTPITTDIDLHQARQGRVRPRGDRTILAAVSVGGATGAAARYLIGAIWPTPATDFPVTTLAINIVGCALIGVLTVLVTEGWSRKRLLPPFLGTGVLGGFTTFSTYTVDIQQRIAGGQMDTALLYLALTPVSALLAAWVAATATRRLVSWRTR